MRGVNIMRSFLKFLVTIIIIAIIGIAVWYLLLIGSFDKDVDIWDKDNEILKNKNEMLEEISSIRKELDEITLPEPTGDTYVKGILDKNVDEYLDFFEQPEMYVQMYKVRNDNGECKIILVPAPDFIDNQIFYFDSNENLLIYISESNGVGGTVEYYFNNDNLLKAENKLEEKIEDFKFEDTTEIIEKAKRIYKRYE